MAMTAEAIIFAINSAIRLGRNAQRAYAKSLTSRSIVLPLPAFSGTPNSFTAQRFFDDTDEQFGGAQYIQRMEKLADIHHRFKNASGAAFPSDDELARYIEYYTLLSALLEQEANTTFEQGFSENRINADELVALLSIRQYTHDGAKHTTPLQMVAGTLVEIGIDYFHRMPGALNEQTATGRTLKHFLKGFDKLTFSDNVALKAQSRKIVPELFIAAAESLADLSADLSNDPKVQDFVQAAGQGIAQDLFDRLATIQDGDHQDEAVRWGRLLLRSTIANAGHFALSSERGQAAPGVDALVKATGSVLLDAILKDPDKLDIKGGMRAETLDRLLQSSFGVLAEHPQLLSQRNGFQEVVSGVSTALKDYSFHRPDLFPELVRLVIEQTGEHLHLFREGDDRTAPEALLIRTVQLLLQELSQPVANTRWRPQLSKTQLLTIAEELLAEVVENPTWIEHEVGGKPVLAAVVRTTLDALAHIPRDARLSADTFRTLLELNLRTVAANERVLQRIHWSSDTQEEAVLQQALTMVFTYIFDDQRATTADRYQLLADLLDYVMDVIISRYPDQKGLMLAQMILFKHPDIDYAGGFNRDLANDLIDAALETLAAHPNLMSNNLALAEIVGGIAGALDASDFKQRDILPELIRLALENTALNAGLVIRADSDEPGFILVTFIRELLFALSRKTDGAEGWQADLTPAEALAIVDALVDQLIQHPEWVVQGPDGQLIFRDVLVAVRNAMQHLPPGVRLTPEQLEMLIALALHAAVTSEAVLDRIPWGTDTEKRSVLERAMALVGSFIFAEMRTTGGERAEQLAELMEFVLQSILVYHPDKRGLVLVQLILFGEADVDYSRGFDEELATQLIESGLRVVQQHPDLLSNEMAVQAIVSDLAAALDANDFRQKGILPELVRLTLEASALNANLIVKAEAGEPKFLITIALRELLNGLSARNTAGQWHPQLTPLQLLALAETLLDELVEHPHWLHAPSAEAPTLWQTVVDAVMDALAQLPVGTRIAPSVLENVILLSLHTAANSPQVVANIRWGTDEQEKTILNQALTLLIAHVYPPQCIPSAERMERFLDLLDYILEVVISKYPDKRSLLLIDMLLFESEVNLQQGFNKSLAEDLIDAAVDIFAQYPELVTQDAVFRKILADTAGALRTAKTPMQHLLPEFIRLTLYYSTGHLEALMRISPNSPRILLAVALEQVLSVVTQPPTRGKWRPTFTDQQVLSIAENVMERVVARPDWVNNDKLLHVTLQALYTALGELRRGQQLPFETVSLLIDAALDAVGQRKQLVLNIVETDGSRKQLVLEYAVGSLFVKLYNDENTTAGAWTLTETENLHALLSAYMLRLAAGPADAATVDALNAQIQGALDQINADLAFALEDLLAALEDA